MAAPIGPGDWIECVGPFADPAERAARGSRIEGSYFIGMVTVCEAVAERVRFPGNRVAPGIKARGVRAFLADGREAWIPAYQWRPVYRPKADFIESLKAPPISAPQRITEAA